MTRRITTILFILFAFSGMAYAADTPLNSPTPTPQMAQSDDGSELYLKIPESVLQSMRDRYDMRNTNAYPTPILIANGGGDPTPTPTSSGSSGSSSGQGGPLKECGNAGAGPTGFAVTTMNNMPNPTDPSEIWTLGTGHSTVRIDVAPQYINSIPPDLRRYANTTIGKYRDWLGNASYNLDDGLTEMDGCQKKAIGLQNAINGLQKIHDKINSGESYSVNKDNCSNFAYEVANSAGMNFPPIYYMRLELGCTTVPQDLTPGILGGYSRAHFSQP